MATPILQPGDPGYVPVVQAAGQPAPTPDPNAGTTPPPGTGTGTTPASTASPSAGTGLGAYDAFANLAFGSPTDAESTVYNATQGIGTNQSPAQMAGNVLLGQEGQTAMNAGNNPQLQNAMVASNNLYNGQDPSQTALNAQQAQYLAMTGPQAGYNTATKAAITNTGNSALNAQQAAAADQMANAAARTGSPIGAYGAIANVSQNIGNQRSNQAMQNQVL